MNSTTQTKIVPKKSSDKKKSKQPKLSECDEFASDSMVQSKNRQNVTNETQTSKPSSDYQQTSSEQDSDCLEMFDRKPAPKSPCGSRRPSSNREKRKSKQPMIDPCEMLRASTTTLVGSACDDVVNSQQKSRPQTPQYQQKKSTVEQSESARVLFNYYQSKVVPRDTSGKRKCSTVNSQSPSMNKSQDDENSICCASCGKSIHEMCDGLKKASKMSKVSFPSRKVSSCPSPCSRSAQGRIK